MIIKIKGITWVQSCLLRPNGYNSSRKLTNKWSEICQVQVTAVSENFSVPLRITEDRHLPWFTKILAKDVPLQILIG
jgi:hypothetical protein